MQASRSVTLRNLRPLFSERHHYREGSPRRRSASHPLDGSHRLVASPGTCSAMAVSSLLQFLPPKAERPHVVDLRGPVGSEAYHPARAELGDPMKERPS